MAKKKTAKKKTEEAKRRKVAVDDCEKHTSIKALGFCPVCIVEERDALLKDRDSLGAELAALSLREGEVRQQYSKAREDLAMIVSAHKRNLETLDTYRKQSDVAGASLIECKRIAEEKTRAAESSLTELDEVKAVGVEQKEKIDLLELDNSLCQDCCDALKKELADAKAKIESLEPPQGDNNVAEEEEAGS